MTKKTQFMTVHSISWLGVQHDLVPTLRALSYTQVFFKVKKNPIFSKNRILSGCRSQKKSDFFKKSDF
jgi:hypothetical protein